MNKAVWAMLNETEKGLLRQVEPAALAELDEDGLVELHDRIRRARTKYTKLYRRRASEQVGDDASRVRAHQVHARTVVKAEAFEEALAVVSRHLAKAAKASADALKAERLAAARGEASPDGPGTAGGGKVGPASAKAPRRTPVSKRSSAQSRAATRRHQTKRDSR